MVFGTGLEGRFSFSKFLNSGRYNIESRLWNEGSCKKAEKHKSFPYYQTLWYCRKIHRSIQCNHSKRGSFSLTSLPWNKESSLSPLSVPEEVCGVSNSRNIQNLTGQGHEQPYQALKPTLLPKVPLNLNYSVVFCLYWRYWYYWRYTCLFVRYGYK